ncbi:MAG: helix-turn-helix domain-containing protein [Pseudorhizobium sp.]
MTVPNHPSFTQWYCEGDQASYVRSLKPPEGILTLLEVERPAGDMSRPAVSDIVLYQDLLGGSRVSGNLGGGRFNIVSKKGDFALAAPDFATEAIMDERHRLRSLAFPREQWDRMIDEATDGGSFELPLSYGRMFESSAIQSAIRTLWALCEEEGAPSRLLARAAGLEILAELCQLGGRPFAPARGGLAPWAERRCLELMRERLSEDIGLDELAAEARLSPFHFARMFKHSLGVPPRVYLTRLRMERVCELLAMTDLPITEIAQQVGYSSNQVLARVFMKHQRMSPTEYRRAVRDPLRVFV